MGCYRLSAIRIWILKVLLEIHKYFSEENPFDCPSLTIVILVNTRDYHHCHFLHFNITYLHTYLCFPPPPHHYYNHLDGQFIIIMIIVTWQYQWTEAQPAHRPVGLGLQIFGLITLVIVINYAFWGWAKKLKRSKCWWGQQTSHAYNFLDMWKWKSARPTKLIVEKRRSQL